MAQRSGVITLTQEGTGFTKEISITQVACDTPVEPVYVFTADGNSSNFTKYFTYTNDGNMPINGYCFTFDIPIISTKDGVATGYNTVSIDPANDVIIHLFDGYIRVKGTTSFSTIFPMGKIKLTQHGSGKDIFIEFKYTANSSLNPVNIDPVYADEMVNGNIVTSCSTSNTAYVFSASGAYSFKKQVDTNIHNCTGLYQWVRNPSGDGSCVTTG